MVDLVIIYFVSFFALLGVTYYCMPKGSTLYEVLITGVHEWDKDGSFVAISKWIPIWNTFVIISLIGCFISYRIIAGSKACIDAFDKHINQKWIKPFLSKYTIK